MLQDVPRTKAYQNAIMQNKAAFKDKVVMGNNLFYNVNSLETYYICIRYWCRYWNIVLIRLEVWSEKSIRCGSQSNGKTSARDSSR